MNRPWIVHGWWNDSYKVKANYSKLKSTPVNSSVIRWNDNQLTPIYNHVMSNPEVIFFTYPSLDNYFNHHWYNIWNEEESFLKGFVKGDIYFLV